MLMLPAGPVSVGRDADNATKPARDHAPPTLEVEDDARLLISRLVLHTSWPGAMSAKWSAIAEEM